MTIAPPLTSLFAGVVLICGALAGCDDNKTDAIHSEAMDGFPHWKCPPDHVIMQNNTGYSGQNAWPSQPVCLPYTLAEHR